jgi:DMSO/TMAO reductase YedYZ molybdopterin-dependent catalytic subunit
VAEAVLRLAQQEVEPRLLNAEARSLDRLVTPAEDRFVRCHFDVPELSEKTHALEIAGSVLRPRRLDLEELRASAAVTLTVTMECAGNWRSTLHPSPPGEPWRKGAISTGQWTGVPLRSLLELRDTAAEVLFVGADGGAYRRSLPREAALDPSVLVAWEMNGQPIPPRFGGPLRLVVPGWYGMASVKWLARIEAIDEPFHGEFQTRKYVYAPGDPVTLMRPKAAFDPLPRAVRAGSPFPISGLAWSGCAIARVQVEVGGAGFAGDGRSPQGAALVGVWHEARLVGPPLRHAWRRFEARWLPARPGVHRLRCRAIDERGESQPDEPRWNDLGYGANGVEERLVEVL